MKKLLPLLGAALVLAMLVPPAHASLSSRKKEKAATYASLKAWQKRYVDTGVIAMNFTPDMVYLAIGDPSKKQPSADGELWTFNNYYPSVAADKVKRTYNTEGAYQPSRNETVGGVSAPRGTSRSGPSISNTGGPQGSQELADLQSYTLWVTFKDGVVSKMKLDAN